ncbi:MAG: BrxE family protein [Candidatus Competibacteraceae bacterium]|nr:BrxE family protein [Candidatus Competibacteraceae bacterium]
MNYQAKESYLLNLLQLRLLVGLLGERAQFAWWPTAFYEASSRLFLEPVFSKTSRLAQYHGVLETARRLHDEHLSVGSYHLFRLPEEVEQDLHAIVQSSMGDELASQVPKSKEAALDALRHLATSSGTSSVGPTAAGSIKDLDSTDTLKAIAGAYLSAFTQNVKTYPYLVG